MMHVRLRRHPSGISLTISATIAQEQKAISFDELPAQIQREIPDITVQLHSYSGKPAERLAYINSKKLREGDSVMPGLGWNRSRRTADIQL